MKIKKTAAEFLAKTILRHSRGSSLVGIFMLMGKEAVYWGLALDLVHRYFGVDVFFWLVPILALLSAIVYYFLGWLDERIGFWKIQNRYANEELNPFFSEMSENIKKLVK